MDYLKHIGSTATIRSATWGPLLVESQTFTDASDGDLVIIVGDPKKHEAPLVRIHSVCVFAEVFDSAMCDCMDQLFAAMSQISKEGCGVLFYLRMDGRGVGLASKVAATALEVGGMDTFDSRVHLGVPPDARSYEKIGEYLAKRGFHKVRMMTNNPAKVAGVKGQGIDVEIVPLEIKSSDPDIIKLYKAKAEKFGHLLKGDVLETG